MIDKIKQISSDLVDMVPAPVKKVLEKVNPANWGPALWEAGKESWNVEGKSFWDRMDVFKDKFLSEMEGLSEEDEASEDEADEEMSEPIDETIDGAEEDWGIPESTKEDDRNFMKEILAAGVVGFRSLTAECRAHMKSGIDKLKKSSEADEDEADELTEKETNAVASVGLMTIAELKKKYPKKADFKSAIARLQKVSGNTKFPVQQLMRTSVLGVFKISDVSEGKKIMNGLGIKSTDYWTSSETMKGLAAKPIENKPEIVDFFHKYILPKTPDISVKATVTLINKLITSGAKYLTPLQVTNLAFGINNADLVRLARVLVGKKSSAATNLV